MPGASRRATGAMHLYVLALCLIFGSGFSYLRGQDINYDQLNYHFYSAYAYWTDRLARDVAPSQVMHSFFSPIVYLPFYTMVRTLPPRLVGLGLGALHGLNLWLVFVIADIVTPALALATRNAVLVCAVVISAAGPMVLSEIGTSYADPLISLPILGGLALLMKAPFKGEWSSGTLTAITLAGAALGAAASLKLTGAAYAIALLVAALVGWRLWWHRAAALLASGMGGVIGFAIFGASWYPLMWRMFRNPVFPYFNTVFRSPDYQSATPLFDMHFIPHGFLRALGTPFLWVRFQTTTAEISFRDVRFAVLIGCGLIAVGRWAMRHGQVADGVARTTPAGRRLMVFFVVAFVIWMYEWSIQRYLITLELLIGPMFVVVLQCAGLFGPIYGRLLSWGIALLALICVLTVRVPDWAHLRWARAWYEVNPPATQSPRPIYFLADDPLAYVVPELQPGSVAIEVIPWENIPAWGDTAFLRRVHDLLADPRNTEIWAVASSPIPDSFRAMVGAYGLKLRGDCQTTGGRPVSLIWCPLLRTAS